MGKLSYEDQGHFLSVMQKRSFTINKHGIHASIACPTSIVASANPTKADWSNPNKIDINEIPLSKQIIDRFPLIFVFKNNNRSEQENDEFVDKLSDIEAKKQKGELPDDTEFIVKYIQYAKHFNPILTDEAIIMIREFYKKVRLQDLI